MFRLFNAHSTRYGYYQTLQLITDMITEMPVTASAIILASEAVFSCNCRQLWPHVCVFSLRISRRISCTIQPGCLWWYSASVPSQSPCACAARLRSASSTNRLQCSSAAIQPSLHGAAQNRLLNHNCLTPHSLVWITDAYILPLWGIPVLLCAIFTMESLKRTTRFLLRSNRYSWKNYYGVKIP